MEVYYHVLQLLSQTLLGGVDDISEDLDDGSQHSGEVDVAMNLLGANEVVGEDEAFLSLVSSDVFVLQLVLLSDSCINESEVVPQVLNGGVVMLFQVGLALLHNFWSEIFV